MAHPAIGQVSHMALRHESRTKGKGRTKHPSETGEVEGGGERWRAGVGDGGGGALHGNAVDT